MFASLHQRRQLHRAERNRHCIEDPLVSPNPCSGLLPSQLTSQRMVRQTIRARLRANQPRCRRPNRHTVLQYVVAHEIDTDLAGHSANRDVVGNAPAGAVICFESFR